MFIIIQSSAFLPTPAKGAGAVEYLVAKLTLELAQAGHTISLLCLEGSTVEHSNLHRWEIPAQGSAVAREGAMSKAIEEIIKRGLGRELGGPVLFDHSLHQLTQRRMPQLPVVTMSHGMAPISPWARNPVFTSEHHGHLHSVKRPVAVHNGIDVDGVPFSLEREDAVIWAGRLMLYKQPHIAIRVAHDAGLKLLVCGPTIDPWYVKDMQTMRDMGDALFLGEVKHGALVKMLGGARALLFTSDEREPAGIIMLEAQAAGTPVLAFDHGANREFTNPGKTSLLVKGEEGMRLALQERFWEALEPVNCRRWVAQHRSIKTMASAAVGALERALEGETW